MRKHEVIPNELGHIHFYGVQVIPYIMTQDGIKTIAKENKSPVLKSHYMWRHTVGHFLSSVVCVPDKQSQDWNLGGPGHY